MDLDKIIETIDHLKEQNKKIIHLSAEEQEQEIDTWMPKCKYCKKRFIRASS